MKFHDIKNLIAKAITEADDEPRIEGYAAANGWGDQAWLSDWSAFLADAVVAKIEGHGLVIRGRFACTPCDKFFTSQEDKDRHKLDVHMPHRRLSSKDRPVDLGDVQCGHCERSFANEWNAAQHRWMAHGVAMPQSTVVL